MQDGACRHWATFPYAIEYLAPLQRADGLWLVARFRTEIIALAGTAPLPDPLPYYVFAGTSAEHLIGVTAGEIGRSKTGIGGPWTTFKSSLLGPTTSYDGRAWQLWTDGRTVALTHTNGGLTVCDLGPP